MTTQEKPFKFFPNHGDEEGRRGYTIIYGDVDDEDHIIVGAEDDEADAVMSCDRLNEIYLSSRALIESWKEYGASMKKKVEEQDKEIADWKNQALTSANDVNNLLAKVEERDKEIAELKEQQKKLLKALSDEHWALHHLVSHYKDEMESFDEGSQEERMYRNLYNENLKMFGEHKELIKQLSK